jgi:hypothetical protein
MDGSLPLGGMFSASASGNLMRIPRKDIQKRLSGLRVFQQDIGTGSQSSARRFSRRIHEAAEFLYVLVYQTAAELDPQVIQWRRQRSMQQSQISLVIQETKLLSAKKPILMKWSARLIAKVKIGDRTGAKEI